MKICKTVTLTICATLFASPALLKAGWAQDVAANLALGKKVIAIPEPNTKDSGNKLEKLTDGKLSRGQISQGTVSMWVQPDAVGWTYSLVSVLMVDLEKVQPISGFSYRTAAGVADVNWPGAIYMLVSDDQKHWRYAGDLVKLSAKSKPAPAYGKYFEHTFSTRKVQATGRYVAFGITSTLYTVTDEIEVFAGDKSWLGRRDKTRVLANQSPDLAEWRLSLTSKNGIDRRVANDLASFKRMVQGSALPEVKKSQFLKKADAIEASGQELVLPPVDFRAILPVSDVHRRALSLHGEFLAAQKYEPLTVWGGQRFEWLDVVGAPNKNRKAELAFSMLGNQHRSQSLLLTNSTSQSQKVNLKLSGAPVGARAGWLQVDEVYWTDTNNGVPVADALKTIEASKGGYQVEVPAGMTRKVWFTLDSSRLAPGSFNGSLTVDNGKVRKQVPFASTVSKIAMKRPRLSLGVWDESNTRSSYAVTPKNYEQALKIMKSHYVDTAWGNRLAVPWPGAADFDAKGALRTKLDFSAFDRWVKDWPEARHFFVFLVATDEFAGEKIDSPLFAAKMGSWARAMADHAREIGLDPRKLGFLLVDEPHTDAQDLIQVAWSRAFNATAPELTLFTDSIWLQPGQIKHPEAMSNFDVLSPNMPFYYRGGETAQQFYQKMRQEGKSLWFYQCDGPTRLFDPQRYFRYQAWHTFAAGGEGQGFWAFADTGKDSWNEYAHTRTAFSAVFLDQNSVTNSIHWDAIREGMQDFEELAMLRDAIAATKNEALRAEGQKLLDSAVKAVTGIWKDVEATHNNTGVTGHYDWRRPDYDATLADRELLKVRAMLERLRS